MPNFKPKTNKNIKVDKKTIETLDNKHNEMLNTFHDEQNIEIPKLLEEKKNLLKTLEKENILIEEKLDIQDNLKRINYKIKQIKKKKKDYLLDNAQHIFEYFEEKKNISNGLTKKSVILDAFFKKETKNDNKNNDNKNKIVKQFFSNIDKNHFDINDYVQETNVCRFCNKGELIPVDEDGLLVCNNCHKTINYLVENEKPSYKEPPKEVCFYAYKRINHFREILAQFQAKETTQIPEKVIEDIKNQIKKERIEREQISNIKAKEILKKLGYNKYYEHIPFIKDIIGIKPPIMTPELEDTLCNLFMEIQRPYAKYCPDDRVNFLNYYYTVYKLCELLEQKQFLPYFPMLKDREKRIEQDNIWKKICDELDWEFIPTI
tara:strand:+ start:446 stop:1573 length:1128 start_codon:yes stop_codon:yes gene_type:complete